MSLRPNAGEDQSEAVAHVAGAPREGVQRCLRCGKILTDNRYTVAVGKAPDPLWWGTGQFVTVKGSVMSKGWREGADLCGSEEED